MTTNNSKEYTPILPYDITSGESFVMYDNMTYHKDYILCNKDTIHMESGNVYKYSTCNVIAPITIGGD